MYNELDLRGDQRFFNTVLNGSLALVLIAGLTTWLEGMPHFALIPHFIALTLMLSLKRGIRKRPERFGTHVYTYLLTNIFLLAFTYFVNAGMNGVSIFIYLALIQAGFLITASTKVTWFVFIIPVVLSIIFTIEFFFPNLVIPYESDSIRRVDVVLSVFIQVGMTTYFSLYSNKWIRREREENQLKTQEIERAHDQTLAALKTREDFLSVMSHEIRTPLNAVLGFSQLLDQTDLNKEQRELNKHILNGGEQLLDLMNQVLDYSRLQKNVNKVNLEELEIIPTLSNACNLHMHKLLNKGLNFELVFDFDLPAIIQLDKPRFLQVLNNLVNNAIKFTDAGVIRISVKLGKAGEFLFEVEDTGIGIKEDYLDLIFDPFEQVDSSLSRSFDGAGLGLAVCQKNAEIMDGQLLVKSELQKGSVFTLKTPLTSCSKSIREFYKHPFGFDSYYLYNSTPDLYRLSHWLDELSCERISEETAVKSSTIVLAIDTDLSIPNHITLYSTAKHGQLPVSRIHIGLFLAQIEDMALANKVEQELFGTQYASKKVLIVDDNRLNQMVAKKMLENFNVLGKVASSGEEALQLCSENDFDLVLMDIYMPGMNGFETSDKLREAGFKGRIVALSAQENIGQMISNGRNSFSGYIPKPLTLQSLRKTLF